MMPVIRATAASFALASLALLTVSCAKRSPSSKSDYAPSPMAVVGGVRQPAPSDREQYDHLPENDFLSAAREPLSTFSIDVDTASYANVRRMLNQGRRPPVDAVRIEELINYFDYEYPEPESEAPFSVSAEVATCPWNTAHRLARIGLRARSVDWGDRPSSNLVFLLDVSGSMSSSNKLPLVKKAMKMLVETLGENDRVAMVVYAGAAGLVLDSTTCDQNGTILEALEGLSAGGSTAGGAGIQLAYKVAERNFIKGGLNRVILCTDGDFNVGISDRGSLTRMIQQKAKSGVFLTVLGFGIGNLQDSALESLADKGNGNYGYIDSQLEARKVLVNEAGGTLITVAKDVKIQVEFNPALVNAYRLIGYENRILAHRDFNDDTKDAGDIGAGHTVTAFYEIVPAGTAVNIPGIDPLKYQKSPRLTEAAGSGELMQVKLRYKEPDGEKSTLLQVSVTDEGRKLSAASRDFHFAAAVAAFGLILRDSKYKGTASLDLVAELATSGKGGDDHGYRAEFIALVAKAKLLPK